MDNLNPDQKPQEEAASKVFKVLQKEYVLFEKTRIKAWHLWLAIGVIGGLSASVFLVSNKSGRFAPSDAAPGRPATVKVISPNGGEQWLIGSTQEVRFETERAPRDAWYVIVLTRYGEFAGDIAFGYTGGSPFMWKIPSHLSAGDGYQVSITMVSPKIKQGQVTDVSDGTFILTSPPTPAYSNPTYYRLSLPSNTLSNGNLVLYRFKATATTTSDAYINNFPFTIIASGGVGAQNFKLYAYADSAFSVPAYYANPIISSFEAVMSGETKNLNLIYSGGSAGLAIPAGTTRYFELRADVFEAVLGSLISTQFDGLIQQVLSK